MIKSLKGWLENSILVRKYASIDGAGDATYATTDVTVSCYLVSKVVTVINAAGKEVTSNIQVYLDGDKLFTRNITDNDLFLFTGSTKTYGVKTISDFYSNGVLSLRVVYL
jgi:hypothetical protein